MLLGVNLSGGEFNPSGSRMFWDYTYPTHAEIDYYAAKGLNVIRLPLLWERLQPTMNGPLAANHLAIIDDLVQYAGQKGVSVDLDLHNYGYGYGNQVGSASTPNSAFADLWGKVAAHYAGAPNVMFGLMNEPHAQSATQWLGSVNAAISAIRAAGAQQMVLVPGTYWDGAWSWVSSDNDTVIGNGVVDAAHNYAFEVHQYLDSDGSGTHADVVSATVGVERLTAITQWAETTGSKLFLGEFGVGTDQTSLTALTNMLQYMSDHSDIWYGATQWGGGPWWGDYMFAVEPAGLGTPNVVDKPHIALLAEFAALLGSNVGQVGGTPLPAFSHEFIGQSGNDLLVGTSTSDVLSGGGGDDNLTGLGGGDVVDGGAGFDFARYEGSGAGVNVRLDGSLGAGGDAQGDTFFNSEGLVGSDFNDVLVGNQVANILYGLAGDDAAYGDSGADTLYGGIGNDHLNGGAGADVLDGGAGFDFARYDYAGRGVVAQLDGGIGAGEASGDFFVSVEGFVGSHFSDVLVGDGVANTVYGQGGADDLYGGAGDDYLDAGWDNDNITGGLGSDTMVGGAGSDYFRFNFSDLAPGSRDVITDFGRNLGDNDMLVLPSGIPITSVDTPYGALLTFHLQEGWAELLIQHTTVAELGANYLIV